jgi:hypothetical protein
MTRKDYELIAKALNDFAAEGRPVDDRDEIAYSLAAALAAENPRFDREKFLTAAGVLSNSLVKHYQDYATGNSFPAW